MILCRAARKQRPQWTRCLFKTLDRFLMDKKSLLIFAASFVLLLVWWPFVNTIYPPEKRQLPETADKSTQTPEPAAAEAGQGNSPVETPSLAASYSETLPSFAEKSETLENEEAKYWFNNVGGGIQMVDLKRYPNETGCGKREERSAESKFAQLNPWAAPPILGLRLGLGETPWIQGYEISKKAGVITMRRELSGELKGVQVEKEFDIADGNYLVRAKTRIVNHSGEPKNIPAQKWAAGTATPMTAKDNGHLMGVLFFDGSKINRVKQNWFENKTLGCFPGQPRSEFYSEKNVPIRWVSVENQFFAITVLPSEERRADQVESRRLNLDFPPAESAAFQVKRGFQTELVFKPQSLPPNKKIECEFAIFAGPKKYDVLAQLSPIFKSEWKDGIMSFGGFFGAFAKALLLSMNWLHGLGLSYGLSIVAITFLIKLLFWPLTQASTRSMKRMAALQPQMKEIQEKYKEDPQKMNKKLMAFMRENRVSPLGGCLPILLQLPVFFGFYTMLQSAIELRGAGFLWTCDLSKPDTIFIIPGLDLPFNLWPILMGAAQIWQMSMTPPSPGMDPMQQKIMKYMPLMFVFILYGFSAGLALYWTVQNLLSIAQMKLTKNEPVSITPRKATALASRKKRQGKKGGRLSL